MNRSSRALAGAAAIVVLGAAGVAHAFPVPEFKSTDPSIASPGYPDFWAANLSASLRKSSAGTGYTLSIQGSDPNIGIFNFPNGAYLVQDEQIKLTANFDSTGHLLTSLANTYEIDGSLRAWSNPSFGTKPAGVSWAVQPLEKLFSANLTAVTVDSKSDALGFKSTGFGGWANQKQFTGGSTTESVWLYSLLAGLSSRDNDDSHGSDWHRFMAELKNHTALKSGTFFGIASIATVPLPAAVWLFGSGLAALGGLIRRRKAA
jgi:hypothetical protein